MSRERAILLEEIGELIKQHSTQYDFVLTDATKLDELGIDSIDLMEIIFRLEEAYGIELGLQALIGKKTVGEVVDFAHETLRN